jgi:signal transduction histidine kinase/CheY-like chemotaxis protein
MSDDQLTRLKKRVERERMARVAAETMLESKSLELYKANTSLRELASELEAKVESRTQAFEEAAEMARAATHAKSEFLATMSHEIRTPLFGVLGSAEVLQQSPLNQDQNALVGTIRSSGENLLALLNEILDFSKLDPARIDLVLSEFDLEEETKAVADLFRSVARSQGLSLDVTVGPQSRLLVGDNLRLRQIISNLLSNAVKFTDDGGIELFVTAVPVNGHTQVSVSVSDTGPGIRESDREMLFEEFRQGDPSTTRTHSGTGLGLAIVSRLAGLMGGDVKLRSEVGRGSTFKATVLMDEGALRSTVQPQKTPSPEAEPIVEVHDLRILLAEDNPVNRMIATAMLEKIGCSALIAEDGGTAVEIVAGGQIDVVLMDLQMPVLDGLEATRRIRSMKLERQPQIVALTANSFESDRESCRTAGMDDFLSKPFSLDDLRELCERLAAARSVVSD